MYEMSSLLHIVIICTHAHTHSHTQTTPPHTHTHMYTTIVISNLFRKYMYILAADQGVKNDLHMPQTMQVV